MACRFSVLKANYFHRLRTSQKAVFKALIPHLVRHRKLVGCFDLNLGNANSNSEWVNITKNSFVGLIENILFKFGLSHEFHTNAFQSRQDFDKLVKSVFRKYYFDIDVSAFANTRQGELFKTVCLPALIASKPFSGHAINPVVFKDSTREHRTSFLQALSGLHFASEDFCAAFKKERAKTCCVFCPSPNRTLMHFISDCPFFENDRLVYHNSLAKTWGTIPQESLLDPVFLFGGKSLNIGPNELQRRCRETVAKTETVRHTAEFLHCIEVSLGKYAKS